MQEDSKEIEIRKIPPGGWYWVENAVIQVFAAKLGLLTIGVYHFLASMADDKQSCFPSQKYVAEHIGCSRSSANKAIRRLETYGLISVDKRTRYHCVYHLLRLPLSSRKTQMPRHRNSDVKPEDTNNTQRTILNNDNVSSAFSVAKTDSLMGFEPKTREELLAFDLAEALKDPRGLKAYLSYARRYPESLLREIVSQVKLTSDQKIRKSRGALFTYLLHHHAKRTA